MLPQMSSGGTVKIYSFILSDLQQRFSSKLIILAKFSGLISAQVSRASDLCRNHKILQKLFEKLDPKLMVSCDECGLMDELTEWGPCTDVHKLAGQIFRFLQSFKRLAAVI